MQKKKRKKKKTETAMNLPRQAAKITTQAFMMMVGVMIPKDLRLDEKKID